MADNIEIDGLVAQREELEQLMTSNPAMEKKLQGAIRKVLMEVRKAVITAAKQPDVMKSDPRQAYKAVKTTVYRQILGGSVSILRKSRGGTQFSNYEPPRNPSHRGGNRRTRSNRTSDLIHYAGPSRNFVLRFLNAGTVGRSVEFSYNESRKVDKWNKHPNTGNRGRIKPRNFFGNSSHKAMRKAADQLTQLIDQIIKQELK